MTTFSVVATPIGNLEDITLRALKTLRAADLVLCEDTRMTKRLLDRHGISVKTMSYHMHSKLSRVEEIIKILKDSAKDEFNDSMIRDSKIPSSDQASGGKRDLKIVLVSDAGTPSISDPGSELVGRIRNEMAEEIAGGLLKLEAIPGPSALTAALSIAGVPCAEFTFLGFLPHKKGRQTLFREILESERTVVFYESPHRILKTIERLKGPAIEPLNKGTKKRSNDTKMEDSMTEMVGDRKLEKRVTICRELTKIFEEVVSGTAEEVEKYFIAHPDKVRGEFVVIVSVK